MYDSTYNDKRLQKRKKSILESLQRAKYRDKFRRIFLKLMGVYSNSKNSSAIVLYSEWLQYQKYGNEVPERILGSLKHEVIKTYFIKWKTDYIDQVKHEIRTQWAAGVIFNILNNKQKLLKTQFLCKLAGYHQEKLIVDKIKKDFKAKVDKLGYLKISKNFHKGLKILNRIQKLQNKKLIITSFHQWHYKVKVSNELSKQAQEKLIKQKKLKDNSAIFALGILNEILNRKLEYNNKDVEKALLLSNFLKWKKVALSMKTKEQKRQIVERINTENNNNISTHSGYSSDSEYEDPDDMPIHIMIRNNQLLIKQSLENDISKKEGLNDSKLKYQMAIALKCIQKLDRLTQK